MSEIFHKSCYTARSSGYKYRTLSTNTGERQKNNNVEDCTFDRKFKELKREITSRIENEVDQTQKARDTIKEKFEKIDAKINSMLELQNTVTALRDELHTTENTLVQIIDKMDKIDIYAASSEAYSLQSKKSSFRDKSPIFEKEVVDSTLTTI